MFKVGDIVTIAEDNDGYWATPGKDKAIVVQVITSDMFRLQWLTDTKQSNGAYFQAGFNKVSWWKTLRWLDTQAAVMLD